MNIQFTDHSDEVKEEFEAACLRALETCGFVAERYAKKLCPAGKYQGGTLRGSITHQVQDNEKAVYIGTDVEYGAYVELGTGIYYPGGRKTPWVYQDAKGNWHMTNGQRAKPYLKPAVADHTGQYINIIKKELKGTGGTVSGFGET